MAATNASKQQTAAIVEKLRNADQRWARRNNDQPAADEYLQHLACSLGNPTAPSTGKSAPTTSDADVTRLREQVVAAENNAAARRAELDQARAELDELRSQVETEHNEALRATGALEATRRERDDLAEQLATALQTASDIDLVKVQEQAKLIRQLRSDYDAAVADNEKTANELAAAQAERDHFAKRLTERAETAKTHKCSWQWNGPDEPIKPCTCSRPVPRYEIREVG
jgi:chromosome segregation ATPase